MTKNGRSGAATHSLTHSLTVSHCSKLCRNETAVAALQRSLLQKLFQHTTDVGRGTWDVERGTWDVRRGMLWWVRFGHRHNRLHHRHLGRSSTLVQYGKEVLWRCVEGRTCGGEKKRPSKFRASTGFWHLEEAGPLRLTSTFSCHC